MTDSATMSEILHPGPADLLAATLDMPSLGGEGAHLPPLWHWTYLLNRPSQRDLGPDGHPTSGIPTPPAPGRRRMFAGGRITHLRPLVLGQCASRETRVVSTVEKDGNSGQLTFVTVRHTYTQDSEVAVVEEHDIVYRAAGSKPLAATEYEPLPDRSPSLAVVADQRLLFRFSALTGNTHRIHYDLEWARFEGYEHLVVHGPLQALMMGEFLRRNNVSLTGKTFSFRLRAPMVGPQTFSVLPAQTDLTAGAVCYDARGTLCAISTFDGRVS